MSHCINYNFEYVKSVSIVLLGLIDSGSFEFFL